MKKSVKYPVFREPEDYMKMRERGNLSGRMKKFFERRAIDRCLAGLTDVKTVCDVPAGPGRLFHLWKSRGVDVLGVDYSEQMAAHATEVHRQLNLEGAVQQGDAFNLADSLTKQPDLIASVRFVYYFDWQKRIELLKSYAAATRRYVLVQYKTTQTLKGYADAARKSQTRRRPREQHMAKVGCSHYEILHELHQAGLVPLRIETIGEFSDRVFVLAEKPSASHSAEAAPALPSVDIRPPRNVHVAAIMLAILTLLYCLNIGDQSFWTKEEALYSLAARNVSEGHLILPMIDGNFPAAVPPLAPWWIAGVSLIFGQVSEFAARLANLLAAIGVLAILYSFVRVIQNRWVALLSIAVLGTSYEFWSRASEAGFSIPMMALLLPAWFSLFLAFEEEASLPRLLVIWGGTALAALAGGPQAIVLTALIAAGYCCVRYGRRDGLQRLRRIKPIAGVFAAILPYAIWLGLIAMREGGEKHVLAILGNDTLGSIIVGTADFRLDFESLEDLVMNFMPWSLLLPFIIWDYIVDFRKRSETVDPLQVFALCSLLTGLLFYLLISNTQEWQILPLMPLGAFVIASYLWNLLMRKSTAAGEGYSGRQFGGNLIGLRYGRLLLGIFFVLLTVMAIYRTVALPLLDRNRSIKPLAAAVDAAVRPDDQLILFDYDDPRLMYYLKERYTIMEEDPEDISHLNQLLLDGSHWDLLLKAREAEGLAELKGVQLYLESSVLYRGERYYVLTNERQPGAVPFRISPAARSAQRLAGKVALHRTWLDDSDVIAQYPAIATRPKA